MSLRHAGWACATSLALLCAAVACRTTDDASSTSKGIGQAAATPSVGVPQLPVARAPALVTWGIPSTAPAAAAATPSTPVTPLVIAANAVPLRGTAPLTVDFSGEATGGPQGLHYRWEFGDGSAPVFQRIARHTYINAGEYTATLNVTGPGVSKSTFLPISVAVGDFACEIEAAPDIGLVPLRVQFYVVLDDTLPHPLSVDWDFGDGEVGSGNPTSHTYQGPGTFTAAVAVTSGDGRTVRRDVLIQVDAPDDAD